MKLRAVLFFLVQSLMAASFSNSPASFRSYERKGKTKISRRYGQHYSRMCFSKSQLYSDKIKMYTALRLIEFLSVSTVE